MVSDVTIGTALDQQSKTAAASTGLGEDFAQFLTLLTVQLQNQDPLEPLDTNELTNQLVAFTGVEQQINSNQKLDSLVALQLGNALSSSLGYVGLDVSYVSSEFFSDGETPITINYAVDGESVDSTLRIVDERGVEVFEGPASTAPGSQEFVWDGKDSNGNPVEPGTYSVRIDALDATDTPLASSTVVEGRVKGVESQGGVIFLIIGERAVALSNVLNANLPDEVSTTDEETPTEEQT